MGGTHPVSTQALRRNRAQPMLLLYGLCPQKSTQVLKSFQNGANSVVHPKKAGQGRQILPEKGTSFLANPVRLC
jgi:hypothetical protein